MARILVIDDSSSAREGLEADLTEAGHQVRTCSDGRSALRLLAKEKFDLIVTDIYMPEEDGLEVIRKGRQIAPGIPIIAMSGITGQRSMLCAARHLGACNTIEKPFTKENLLSVVRTALTPAKSAARREPGSGK